MSITIRRATFSDFNFLMEATTRLHQLGRRPFDPSAEGLRLEDNLRDPHKCVLVAADETNNPVGTLTVEYRESRLCEPPTAYCCDFYVRPEAPPMTAQRLMRVQYHRAKAKGVGRVVIATMTKNHRKGFEKMGFTPVCTVYEASLDALAERFEGGE